MLLQSSHCTVSQSYKRIFDALGKLSTVACMYVCTYQSTHLLLFIIIIIIITSLSSSNGVNGRPKYTYKVHVYKLHVCTWVNGATGSLSIDPEPHQKFDATTENLITEYIQIMYLARKTSHVNYHLILFIVNWIKQIRAERRKVTLPSFLYRNDCRCKVYQEMCIRTQGEETST